MPDLPDHQLCDHEFHYKGYWEINCETIPGKQFFALFICEKCGKIQRVWEEFK